MGSEKGNTLYPVFLKLHELNLLIVGGGATGLEKLSFLLKNSPDAKVTILAKGVYRPKKSISALLEPINHIHIQYYHKNSFVYQNGFSRC